MKYTTISVTDGYSLIYSFWSDAVSRQAGLILSIDETKAKRERDRWEQEKEAEKRREQEEEDARGYDGL